MPLDDRSDELSLEEILRELGARVRRDLDLDDYFQVFEWAKVFFLQKENSPPWHEVVNVGLGGRVYAQAYLKRELADRAAGQGQGVIVVEVPRAREFLRRIPDGLGLIIDYDTNGTVRIEPDELTELDEQFRIKPVRAEATEQWLRDVNSRLADEGVPEEQRGARARAAWALQNQFGVVAGSRRACRIDYFFAAGPELPQAARRARLEGIWRAEYAADPYLHHVDNAVLKDRLLDISTNILYADRPTLPHEFIEAEWAELLEHVRSEYTRRGLDLESDCKEASALGSWPRLEQAKRVLNEYRGPKGQLFKFGASDNLEALLETGAIRISPASSYADPSLNRARRDNELARAVLIDPRNVRLEHIGPGGGRTALDVLGSIQRTVRLGGYYVWCTTTGSDPRLFDDFDADSCLVIHDALTFGRRLYAAMEQARPGFLGAERLVKYFDPLRAEDQTPSTFHKDQRFSYQREYRFVWDPPGPPISQLEVVNAQLGNLEDVASIVRLKDGG